MFYWARPAGIESRAAASAPFRGPALHVRSPTIIFRLRPPSASVDVAPGAGFASARASGVKRGAAYVSNHIRWAGGRPLAPAGPEKCAPGPLVWQWRHHGPAVPCPALLFRFLHPVFACSCSHRCHSIALRDVSLALPASRRHSKTGRCPSHALSCPLPPWPRPCPPATSTFWSTWRSSSLLLWPRCASPPLRRR